MKIKPTISKTFTFKTLIILTCLCIGFVNFTSCYSQSVVGKWKRTGTKFFVADKTTGKQIPVSAQMQQQYDQASAANGYTEILEFKHDNTYVSSVSSAGDAKPITHNGSYSLSGNNLDMKIPLVNNQKTSITIKSIDSGTMIWDLLFMGKLSEIIYTKM